MHQHLSSYYVVSNKPAIFMCASRQYTMPVDCRYQLLVSSERVSQLLIYHFSKSLCSMQRKGRPFHLHVCHLLAYSMFWHASLFYTYMCVCSCILFSLMLFASIFFLFSISEYFRNIILKNIFFVLLPSNGCHLFHLIVGNTHCT